MALWDRVKAMIAAQPILIDQGMLEQRAIDSFVDHPGLTEQLLAVQGLTPRPWRVAGLREALGVPAIFGAVTLISNIVGSLTMRALRNEIELPPAERPRVIVRPDPFRIPREFYRQTAYNMATRGEAWWWIGARDTDGNALSVLNIPPSEVTVEENPKDLRYPIIKWRGKTMQNEDVRQIVYQQEPGILRGVGPLQLCQAAISVAVEAQEWAANYYAEGGLPSVVIHSKVQLTAEDAAALKAQWVQSGNNTPKVVDDQIGDIDDHQQNTEAAQMLTAREYQNGDVARMFGIPGTLLDYAVSGSSIVYQNVGQEFDNFLRRCLAPNYLIPIEQTMSDLLPRSTVARFDVDRLVMADIKTRYDVYSVGIPIGVITSEEARQFEGRQPGDTDNAAVPFSPPQAVPNALPIQTRSEKYPELRCGGTWNGAVCGRLLNEEAPPGTVARCPRCKARNVSTAAPLENRNVGDERWHEFMAAMAQRPEPQQPIVNVYPADVNVHPPEVNVHPSPVTVNPPSVHVEQPHITVEQPDLAAAFDRVMAGQEQLATRAIQALEKASERPVNVTVETPDVHVDSPVHIHEGAVNAPVTVQQPQPLPVAAPQPMRRVVKRDKADRIIEVIEEPA
jgi:HK97 family phage portal protein